MGKVIEQAKEVPVELRVSSARSHVGVQVGAAVFNAIQLGKNGIKALALTQYGLHIDAGKEEYIIPYSNLQSIKLG